MRLELDQQCNVKFKLTHMLLLNTNRELFKKSLQNDNLTFWQIGKCIWRAANERLNGRNLGWVSNMCAVLLDPWCFKVSLGSFGALAILQKVLFSKRYLLEFWYLKPLFDTEINAVSNENIETYQLSLPSDKPWTNVNVRGPLFLWTCDRIHSQTPFR